MHFDVLCCACRAARRDTHVMTSATRSNARSISASAALTYWRQILFWLVHYVKIISLLLLPKNVIDAVQIECNLYQIGSLQGK